VLLKYLSKNLPTFITLWSQSGSQAAAENANRLIMATKSQSSLEDNSNVIDEKANALAQATLQVESIPDLTVLPTRPGMFIFLWSLVSNIPD
jgi:hypothetical protein